MASCKLSGRCTGTQELNAARKIIGMIKHPFVLTKLKEISHLDLSSDRIGEGDTSLETKLVKAKPADNSSYPR